MTEKTCMPTEANDKLARPAGSCASLQERKVFSSNIDSLIDTTTPTMRPRMNGGLRAFSMHRMTNHGSNIVSLQHSPLLTKNNKMQHKCLLEDVKKNHNGTMSAKSGFVIAESVF